jgi:broad specificity phosphatase PhoE
LNTEYPADRRSYVSPRKRAQRTLELLSLGCRDKLPWEEQRTHNDIRTDANVQVTEDIREWDYGDYEGITSPEIRKRREAEGIEGGKWDIWRDGCPGGECVVPFLSPISPNLLGFESGASIRFEEG